MIEIGTLPFSHVADPVTLEVISISLSKHSITVALTLVPLTLVYVFVCVNHSSLTLRHALDPVAIVSVSILIEECASAVLLILKPISSIFSAQFPSFIPPISSLTVSLISLPQALILVAILVELNAESILLVVLPVANIARGVHPLLALDAAIFLPLLLLDPVDRAMRAVLLRLVVAHLPQMVEGLLLSGSVGAHLAAAKGSSTNAAPVCQTL